MKALLYIPLAIFLFSLVGCSEPEFAELANSVGQLEDPPVAVDRFGTFSQRIDQETEDKIVDLLIVIDNSTSMSQDQAKLSREFASFVDSISDADYRIGVITTDTDTINKENEEGFYGNLALVESTGRRYISKSDVNPSALFRDLVRREESVSCVGPGGFTIPDCVSFNERPLYAIKMAIDKRNTVNQGFFREGADLGVVIITDEDEFVQPDGSFYSAANLLSDFETEFGMDKKMIAFDISIPEGDEVCLAAQKAETASKSVGSYAISVQQLTTMTQGFGVNICDPNFSLGLGLISNYVEKSLLPLKIEVKESIVLRTIVLSVTQPDGEPFDAKYTVNENVLEVFPLPPVGSDIQLSYQYKL